MRNAAPTGWRHPKKGLIRKGQGSGMMWRNFTKAVRELQRTFADGSGTYRPDRHYMRGPGPKWHAKYGHLAPKPGQSAPSPASRLHDLSERRA